MVDQIQAGAGEPAQAYRSLWVDVWLQFKAHGGAMVGITVFLAIVLAVVIGPSLRAVDPQYRPSSSDTSP